jgi:hypothetical protein
MRLGVRGSRSTVGELARGEYDTTDGKCAQQNPLFGLKRPGTPDWDAVHAVVSPVGYDDYVLAVPVSGPS